MVEPMTGETTIAERFARDGFCVVADLATPADLAELRGAYVDLLEGRVHGGDPTKDERLLAIDDPAAHLDLASAIRCPLPAGSATVHGYTTPHYTGPNRSTRNRRAYIFSFADPDRLAALRPAGRP